MPVSGWKWSLSIACWAVVATALTHAPEAVRIPAPATTREHLQQEKWWPTAQVADDSQFAGEQACAGCHAGIARTQVQTQMAHTMMPVARSAFLAEHRGQVYQSGEYRYRVEPAAGSYALTVSDGTHATHAQMQWAFGSGEIAQGYLWWDKGQLYESRFNYYGDLHGFDTTPGRLAAPPVTAETAEGRQVANFEARTCYACHSTGLTTTEPVSAAHFQPGITCEGCHGPGRAHVDAMNMNPNDEPQIANPAHLAPAEAVDFCGACHATAKDVELMGFVGQLTVRFPVYRLEKSRCWGEKGDARLTCFACHNPHQPLEKNAAAYDAACLRCHASGQLTGRERAADAKPCPVAKTRCTSCHMPKVNLAGMHYDFTDHDIRIVKKNAPFPD